MKVWTIQCAEVYDIIQRTGEYSVKEDFIDNYYKSAYLWLTEQMKNKIGPAPDDVTFPIWAWYRWNGKNKKPDLRSSSFGKTGDRLICMELDIPDNEICLSDFDSWHFVLNYTYLNNGCEDEETFNSDWEKLNKMTPERRKEAIEKSWENIFDIDFYKSAYQVRGEWVQGTFWKIKKEYIKKVQFFKCR